MRQIGIIHLSDLHFGAPHFFQPPIPPDGVPAANTRPSLSTLIVADLNGPDLSDLMPRVPDSAGGFADMPLVVAVSGDLTETAAAQEFDQAEKFLAELTKAEVLKSHLKRDNVFVVPGNHDVIHAEEDLGRRWYPYCDFSKRNTGVWVDPKTPQLLTRVVDRSEDGFIVAEVNSCAYVKKDSAEAIRGQIDDDSLFRLKQQLRDLPADRRHDSVRFAIMHHHPVVLPALAEAGRGYDAIVNSNALLALLQHYGFHIVFHGHKHYPHTFSYDARCAWSREHAWPLSVIAGGSIGSRYLPDRIPDATNVYNYVTLKWDPVTTLARIRIVTRGLVTHDGDGNALLPAEWHFRTLRVDDRVSGSHMPEPEPFEQQKFAPGPFEDTRRAVYHDLRLNMPVVEVMPSLMPGQEYEARLWIVGHDGRKDIPVKVEWAAGRHFPVIVCTREQNPTFCVNLAYYGPMLAQARMYFDDGTVALAHVYARLPSAQA